MTEIQLKNLIKACIKNLNEGFGGMNRKELDEILNLGYINGVPTLDKLAVTKKHRLEIYDFVMQKCRWILNFEYPIGGKWSAPFRHFFKEEGGEYENWIGDFQRTINEELNAFKYWINLYKTTNVRDLNSYKIIQEISKKYPTFERDLTNLSQYVDTFKFKTAESPLNPENYPLYVSLYKPSREYGGPEEGGWYYTYNHYITSIKVNNYKEARVAAVKLIREMPTHVYGNPKIYLEKTLKCLETRERPHYS